MNVQDLRQQLDELEEAGLIDDGTELRFAYQPNYPLWSALGILHPGNEDAQSTIVPEQCEVCGCDPAEEGFRHYQGCTEEDTDPGEDREPATHLYLVESNWSSGGYASRKLWDEPQEWL